MYRSTNLDGWNGYQIRMMKFGGNKHAAEAMKVPVGSGVNDNAHEKYSNRLATEYKQRLTRLVQQDMAQ